MHIGIDFDNTIVTYDNLFHKYALGLGLISSGVAKNKQVIRDTIRMLSDGNDKWTELQGLVYGTHMDEAEIFEGVRNFLDKCREMSAKVSVISHKTIYPALGPRVNLREAARKWIEANGFYSEFGLSENDIVFEETLAGKLSRISERGCTYFIDDLPEVLLHPDFPSNVAGILYAKNTGKEIPGNLLHFENWDEIREYFFG
ncbi:MAG: hypothetical protein A2X59_04220 [Nitrospirae bacterium GWC2_42_7]|nr:MAG: hypothetical protein A2X59_04220 [Nitrospirae bacterium GWC2_42_7]